MNQINHKVPKHKIKIGNKNSELIKKKYSSFLRSIFYSNRFFIMFFFSILFSVSYCSSTVRFSANTGIKSQSNKTKYYVGQVLKGECSFYASKFHGRKTASGEIYNMFALTAAHRTLPFGTILEVENLSNGKKVKVRINDRGPFKSNRILDVSLQAAKKLDMIKQGTIQIKATIIKLGKKN